MCSAKKASRAVFPRRIWNTCSQKTKCDHGRRVTPCAPFGQPQMPLFQVAAGAERRSYISFARKLASFLRTDKPEKCITGSNGIGLGILRAQIYPRVGLR